MRVLARPVEELERKLPNTAINHYQLDGFDPDYVVRT
jgi:hypothetical protein